MKRHLYLLATCGALMLSACKGSIGSPKQPAWVDAQPCQQELPPLVDYTKDQPLGGDGDVVVVEPGEGDTWTAWVANPKDGTIPAGYKINPDDYVAVVQDRSDRIAGSIVRPNPPPPPNGGDRLRWIIGLASRIRQTAPMKCSAMPSQPTSPTHL
jgi:hypothetical protein